MKGKLFYWALSFYDEFILSGVRPHWLNKEKKRKIIRFNQFILLALLVILFSVVTYLYNHLYISALINISAAYLFLLAYYFTSRQKLETGRILSVITVNGYLIIMCFVEGLRSGDYLLFFPYFLALTFIVSIRRNVKELVIVYALSIYSLIVALVLSPASNDIEIITAAMYRNLFGANLTISFLLTMVFSYVILRSNKDFEEQLLQEKIFGETIYNTSLDAVLILYTHTHVIASCNQRALELFEVPERRQLEGTALQDWFPGAQLTNFRRIEKQLLQGKKNWGGEFRFTTHQGNTLPAYISLVLFRHRDMQYIKVSILDVSSIKMAEFELMRAKEQAELALGVKTRFLSTMSHELRTPLNGIIGVTHLLKAEPRLPGQEGNLSMLEVASAHMLQLINDILDFTKIESGKLELSPIPVHLEAFIRKVAGQFSTQVAKKQLHFRVELIGQLDVMVLADDTRLHQILSNLLSNAIKFTHSGSITLQVEEKKQEDRRITLEFLIRDTGIGIPEEKHQEIFESFTQAEVTTTRNYGGTGLGLTITRDLVKQFGGTLQLDSHPGKGSTFYFTLQLPLEASLKSFADPLPATQYIPFTGIRALIAEDNPVNLNIALKFLEKWGIACSVAQDGKEALAVFNSGTFDLIILDIEMPVMDGRQVIQEIRKKDAHIPALAFTADILGQQTDELLQLGFTDHIHKPFQPVHLYEKIQALLFSKQNIA